MAVEERLKNTAGKTRIESKFTSQFRNLQLKTVASIVIFLLIYVLGNFLADINFLEECRYLKIS